LAIVGIIPARFGSTRLPGKPLSDIHGKTMIQHVYERASRARCLDRLLVATDDERIASAVVGFGGEAVMTSARHQSGTDRLAEAVARTDATVVVNIQGDEPMLDPAGIEVAVAALREDPEAAMATLSVPILDHREMLSSAVVKVVADERGHALYFSRSPIPFVRDAGDPAQAALDLGIARKHVGLYVYRREALIRFASYPQAPLERAEGLEQLRALHHGMRIRVAGLASQAAAVAVDTPDDLARVRLLLAVSPS
jgi:3-deoxy-manno-octulosonate cytidylyltransferase (CMP-KDO synthetase)